MAIEITVLAANGQVKIKDTATGTIRYFQNSLCNAMPDDDHFRISDTDEELYEYKTSDVTLPAGSWTTITLCDTLNKFPYFYPQSPSPIPPVIPCDLDIPGTSVDDTLRWDGSCWVVNTNFQTKDLAGNNLGAGVNPLDSRTTGTKNTAYGISALKNLTTGSENEAIGFNSGLGLTTGIQNTALGTDALLVATGPQFNQAIGYHALRGCPSPMQSVAIGWNAGGQGNPQNCVLIGADAGSFVTGNNNICIGVFAGNNITSGNNNTIIGFEAGFLLDTSSSDNTAIGYFSLSSVTTGSFNLGVGAYSGNGNVTGSDNVCVGRLAALQSNSSNCHLFGNNTSVSAADIAFGVAIGNTAQIKSNNSINFGSSVCILKDFYFGKGQDHTSSVNCTFQNSSIITTADTASGTLTIQSGKSTGSANGGNIVMRVSPAGGSGVVQNTQTDQVTVKSDGIYIENKVYVTAGSNKSVGIDNLTTGTVTVLTAAVTASSIILVTSADPANTGSMSTGNIVAGTSFDIISTNNADTGNVSWFIIN